MGVGRSELNLTPAAGLLTPCWSRMEFKGALFSPAFLWKSLIHFPLPIRVPFTSLARCWVCQMRTVCVCVWDNPLSQQLDQCFLLRGHFTTTISPFPECTTELISI
jgi:hypothetical protein